MLYNFILSNSTTGSAKTDLLNSTILCKIQHRTVLSRQRAFGITCCIFCTACLDSTTCRRRHSPDGEGGCTRIRGPGGRHVFFVIDKIEWGGILKASIYTFNM